MSDLPPLSIDPNSLGAGVGFRANTVVAAIIETSPDGNRVVIQDLPPNGGEILFYVGVPGETPARLLGQLDGANEPILVISAGSAGAAPGGSIPTIELVGDNGLHTNERSLDLIADDIFLFKTNPGSAALVARGHATALTHTGAPLVGSAYTLGMYLEDFGQLSLTTTGTGQVTIPFAQPAFAGIGGFLASVLQGGAIGWDLASITLTQAVLNLYVTNTGIGIGPGVTVPVSWRASGW